MEEIDMYVIFLDIDGTLVTYDLNIPDSARKAVQQTRKKGNKVYLTTGRSKSEVYPELWDIGLDGMIGGNGMYIEDGGEILLDLCMKQEDVVRTVDWMQANGLGFYLESKNGLFGNDALLSKTAMQLYGQDTEATRKQVHDTFPEMIFDGELYRSDVAKISFCLYPNLLDEARAKFGDVLKVDSWSAHGTRQDFGEFAVLGADKVHAVKQLLDHLHVSKEQTFAFGDAESDIQMISFCEVGIAMGNAKPALKQVADDVTQDVAQDGLWNAFVKHGLV